MHTSSVEKIHFHESLKMKSYFCVEEKEGYALTPEASFGDFFNLHIHTSVTTHPILKIEKKKFSFFQFTR